MNSASTIRFFQPFAIGLLLACAPTSSIAETVIGPGPVPAPLIIGPGYRMVAGTEVIATTSGLSGDGGELYGQVAVGTPIFYSDKAIFEGGTFQGASVTTQPGVFATYGGSAVTAYTANLEFRDGVYRGGSIIVDDPAHAGGYLQPGSAFRAGGDEAIVEISIFGGVFEGGTVSMALTPGTPISRAPALLLSPNYGGSIDIFGGEFIGGIESDGPTVINFYGDFDVQPTSPNGRYLRPVELTVAGRYADGTPNSTVIHFVYGTEMINANGKLSFGYFNLPEPAASTLVLIACIAPTIARRKIQRSLTS